MDILSWTKLNHNILVESVTRRFFNRYCYKLDIELHGSSFLRYPDVPIEEQIAARKRVNRNINFGGTWRAYVTKAPDIEEIKILEFLLKNHITNSGAVKFRIEEPTLSVYAESEKELYDFATSLIRVGKIHQKIKKIHRPKSQDHLDLLEQGFTVKQSKYGYTHKVMLREGRYSFAVKQQLHNYLKNLGDEVYLPKHLHEALEKPFDSFWGSYFYTKDLGIITMISLISPTFVRSVETYQAIDK
jgi:hypothetical protein